MTADHTSHIRFRLHAYLLLKGLLCGRSATRGLIVWNCCICTCGKIRSALMWVQTFALVLTVKSVFVFIFCCFLGQNFMELSMRWPKLQKVKKEKIFKLQVRNLYIFLTIIHKTKKSWTNYFYSMWDEGQTEHLTVFMYFYTPKLFQCFWEYGYHHTCSIYIEPNEICIPM